MPCAGCGDGEAREGDDGLFPVRYPNGNIARFASAEAANSAVTQYGAEWIGPKMKGLGETSSKKSKKNTPEPVVDDPAGNSPSEEGS